MSDVTERPAPADRQRGSLFRDIYRDRTRINFVARRRWFLVSSLVAVAISILAIAVRDLNLNIDFEGGSQWQVAVADGDPDVGDVRDLVDDLGVENPRVTTLGGNEVRVQAKDVEPETEQEVIEALAEYAGVEPGAVSFTSVGPTWGDQISEKMIQATLLFMAAVTIYLALRLELKMALSALVALAHDLVIVVGVYAILQLEVSPATVVAILTILGYSLYDTVVVFDKIKENESAHGKDKRFTYSGLANLSINQTLSRSLNTTVCSVLPVLSIIIVGALILGATGLEEFGVALLIGLLVGAYSSIFVASQLLIWWREREGGNQDLRERVAARNPDADIDMLWPEIAPATPRTVTARPRRGSSGRALPLAGERPADEARPVLLVKSPDELDAPGATGLVVDEEVAEELADELAGLPARPPEEDGADHEVPPRETESERIARTSARPASGRTTPAGGAPRPPRPRGKKRR
jgi:preprotein translocase subunit SecF